MGRTRALSLSLLAAIVAVPAFGSDITVYIDGVRNDGRFPPLLRNGRTMMFL
ncbi:MAG: hypothetical protein H6534_05780, partial [Chthonomonadaceae bacterium]|nr:hypothetical protein [Chthonomonadaceae bacterium]